MTDPRPSTPAETLPRPERRRDRYSWILLLVVGLASLAIGVGDFVLGQAGDTEMVVAVTGMTWSELTASYPSAANLVDLLARVLGAWLTGFSLFAIAVSVTAYRRGERWAWFAMWSLPLAMTLVFVAFASTNRIAGEALPPALLSAPTLAAVSAASLLVSSRRFLRPWPGRP